MNKARKTLLCMLLTATLLGSCAGQAPTSEALDVNEILTQNVGTFAAAFFQTQTAMVTPATATPLSTPTFIPTGSPIPLPSALASATYIYYTAIVYPSVTSTGTQYTPTVNPSTLAYGCNNLGLINDLGPASGTTMQPGTRFTKTWQVANTGTCDWVYTYRLVFVSGNRMEGESVRLSNRIEPNKWTRLSVSLTAPNEPGTYSGYWQLSDGAGHSFGATLPVSIVVKAPTRTPRPTTTSTSTYP